MKPENIREILDSIFKESLRKEIYINQWSRLNYMAADDEIKEKIDQFFASEINLINLRIDQLKNILYNLGLDIFSS